MRCSSCLNQRGPCRKCIGEALKITDRCRAEAVARAVAAEAEVRRLKIALEDIREQPHNNLYVRDLAEEALYGGKYELPRKST